MALGLALALFFISVLPMGNLAALEYAWHFLNKLGGVQGEPNKSHKGGQEDQRRR